MVPLFKAGRIKFVEEMKNSRILGLFLEQISMVTRDGIKGKDDCVDTVSMLQYMNPWTPTGDVPLVQSQNKEIPREVWGGIDDTFSVTDDSSYSSYMA